MALWQSLRRTIFLPRMFLQKFSADFMAPSSPWYGIEPELIGVGIKIGSEVRPWLYMATPAPHAPMLSLFGFLTDPSVKQITSLCAIEIQACCHNNLATIVLVICLPAFRFSGYHFQQKAKQK